MLGAHKVKHCEEPEFRKKCAEYFDRYYKFLAMNAALVLPSVIPTKFKGLVDTMV